MASKYPVQLMRPCVDCGVDGWCGRCIEGLAPAWCLVCNAAAFHRRGLDYLCPACFYLCEECEATTPPDDRLPFVDGTFLHFTCAARMSLSLESHDHDGHTGMRANADARVRASAQEDIVPKVAESLIEVWRRRGYVTVAEAAELSGHPPSTLLGWIATKRLDAERSGACHFIRLASLQACCPQVGMRTVAQ